jgi:hypothetical protein
MGQEPRRGTAQPSQGVATGKAVVHKLSEERMHPLLTGLLLGWGLLRYRVGVQPGAGRVEPVPVDGIHSANAAGSSRRNTSAQYCATPGVGKTVPGRRSPDRRLGRVW